MAIPVSWYAIGGLSLAVAGASGWAYIQMQRTEIAQAERDKMIENYERAQQQMTKLRQDMDTQIAAMANLTRDIEQTNTTLQPTRRVINAQPTSTSRIARPAVRSLRDAINARNNLRAAAAGQQPNSAVRGAAFPGGSGGR